MSSTINKKSKDIVERAEKAADQIAENVTQATKVVSEEIQDASPIPTKTLEHLQNYPLVKQTSDTLYEFPPTKMAIGSLQPVVHNKYVYKLLSLAKPATWAVDTLTDKSLDIVDKFLPSLQTKTYQSIGDDIKAPITYTLEKTSGVCGGVKNVTYSYGVEPVQHRFDGLVKFYNDHNYDAKGKPLVRGSLDPLVGPINDQFEKLLSSNRVSGLLSKEYSQIKYNSEVNRSFGMFYYVVTTVIPLGGEKLINLVKSPFVYTKHVTHVFNENLVKEGEKLDIQHSFNASKNSIVSLEKEAVEYIKEFNPLSKKEQKKKTVSDKMSDAIDMITPDVLKTSS